MSLHRIALGKKGRIKKQIPTKTTSIASICHRGAEKQSHLSLEIQYPPFKWIGLKQLYQKGPC